MAKSREVLSKAQEQLDYATSRCGNLMEQLDKIKDQMKLHRGQDGFKTEEILVGAGARGDNNESEAIQLAREDVSIGSDLSNSSQSNDYSKKVDKKWDKFYKKLSKGYRNRHKLSRSSSSYESVTASADTFSTKSLSTEEKKLINKQNKQSNEMEDDDDEAEEEGDEDELVVEAMVDEVYEQDYQGIIDEGQLVEELEDFSEEEEEDEEEDEEEEEEEGEDDGDDDDGQRENENVEEDNINEGVLSDDYEKEFMENENTPGIYHYRREVSSKEDSQEENENDLEEGRENEKYDEKEQQEVDYDELGANMAKGDFVRAEEVGQHSDRETSSSESLVTGVHSLNTISDSSRDKLDENNNESPPVNSYDDQVTHEEIIMLNVAKEKMRQEEKSIAKIKSKENVIQTGESNRKLNKQPKLENKTSNEVRPKEQQNSTRRIHRNQPDLKENKVKMETLKKVDLTKRINNNIKNNNSPTKPTEQTGQQIPVNTKGIKNKLNAENTNKGNKKIMPNKRGSNENLNTRVNPSQSGELANKSIMQQQQQQQKRQDKKPVVKNAHSVKDKKDVKNIQESRKAANIVVDKKGGNEVKSKEQDKAKTKTITRHLKQASAPTNRKQNDLITPSQERLNLRTPNNVRQRNAGQSNTVKHKKNEAINSNHLIQLNYTDVENNLYIEKLSKLKNSNNKIKKSQNPLKPTIPSHEIISKGLLDNIQKTLRDNLNRPTDMNYNNNGEVRNNYNENIIPKNAVKNKVNIIESNPNHPTTATRNLARKENNYPKQRNKEAEQKQKFSKNVENVKTSLAKDETIKIKNRNASAPSRGNQNPTNELNMFKTFGQDEDDAILEDCRDEETLNMVTTNTIKPVSFDLKANIYPYKVESAQHINKRAKTQHVLSRPGTENVVKPPPHKFLPYKSNKIWEETIPEVDKAYIKGQTNKNMIPNMATNNNNNNNKENMAQSLAQSLGFNAIPFIVGQSTSRSYHIGLNIQQTMSLMKHSPSMPALKLGIEPSAGNNCEKTSSFGSILSNSYYKAKTCPACTIKPFNNSDEYEEDEDMENADDPWYVPQKDTWDKHNIANRKRARCTCLPKNVISFNEVLNQLFQTEGFTQMRPHSSETHVIIKSEQESEKDEKENKKVTVRPNNAFYFTRLLRNIQRIQDQYMPTTKLSLNSIKYNTL